MELNASGSENRHIPGRMLAKKDPIRMTSRSRAARTDDYELFRGKRRILGVGRHGSNITIRWQLKRRSCTW
jgi:hypothetical protein